jgi:hypothetical protein
MFQVRPNTIIIGETTEVLLVSTPGTWWTATTVKLPCVHAVITSDELVIAQVVVD